MPILRIPFGWVFEVGSLASQLAYLLRHYRLLISAPQYMYVTRASTCPKPNCERRPGARPVS